MNNTYDHDLESGQDRQSTIEASPVSPLALEDENSITRVLSQRWKIDQELQQVTCSQEQLQSAQISLLDSVSSTEGYQARVRVDSINNDITGSFSRVRGLVTQLKRDCDMTDPRIQSQMKYISDNLKRRIQGHYRLQSEFEQRLQAQVRRRYEIAHPDATIREVNAGVQDAIYGDQQVFEVPGRRTAQASDSRSAVMQRSLAIRKIQEDMTALNELFNEVASLVEQQEYPVQKINEDTEKTVEDYKNANSHLSRGIISAQNARKYKWWILFICLLIIAIIVLVGVLWCKLGNHC